MLSNAISFTKSFIALQTRGTIGMFRMGLSGQLGTNKWELLDNTRRVWLKVYADSPAQAMEVLETIHLVQIAMCKKMRLPTDIFEQQLRDLRNKGIHGYIQQSEQDWQMIVNASKN